MALPPQRQSHIVKQRTGPDDPILHETLQEALAQVSAQDVISIADELSDRQERLFLNLEADPASLKSSFADSLLRSPTTRANAQVITNYFNNGNYDLITNLLITDLPTPVRVAKFVETLDALDTRLALELASGLLYNMSPKELTGCGRAW